MLLYKGRQDLKMFLEVLLSLFTVSVFGFFAIRPTSVTIASLITDIKSKQDTISTMDQKIQDLTTAQQNLSQNEALVDILNISIPETPNVDTYLRQIEGISSKNAVTIETAISTDIAIVGDSIELVPDLNSKIALKDLPLGAKPVKISITVSGNFQNLLNFIKDIETLRRPISIDSVSLGTFSSLSKTNPITMTIDGRLPYLKK